MQDVGSCVVPVLLYSQLYWCMCKTFATCRHTVKPDTSSAVNSVLGFRRCLRCFFSAVKHLSVLQGVLTNSEADINVLIEEDLTALSKILGDKPYFLGATPSAADASAFGTLENYLYDGNDATPIPALTRKFPNLVRFVDAIRADYYPDKLDKGGKSLWWPASYSTTYYEAVYTQSRQ